MGFLVGVPRLVFFLSVGCIAYGECFMEGYSIYIGTASTLQCRRAKRMKKNGFPFLGFQGFAFRFFFWRCLLAIGVDAHAAHWGISR